MKGKLAQAVLFILPLQQLFSYLLLFVFIVEALEKFEKLSVSF